MPKLLSSMHPLSQLPLLSVLVLTLRRSLPNFPSIPPPPFSPFSCSFATRSLPLDTLPPLPSRPSVSRLSSCDTPNLYALILVHTDSGYLRERGIYFWQRLPCIMPGNLCFLLFRVPFTRDRFYNMLVPALIFFFFFFGISTFA